MFIDLVILVAEVLGLAAFLGFILIGIVVIAAYLNP